MQQVIGQSGMYLQGYEDYVIDGVAGAYTKATVARQLLNTRIHLPTRIKRLEYIPLKVFGKIYGNAGYVYSRDDAHDNILNNKMLYSGGIGLDVILLYDFILRVEPLTAKRYIFTRQEISVGKQRALSCALRAGRSF
jgi:hypothetical protein